MFVFISSSFYFLFFFFNDPATTEIYTLSLHDALPILGADRPSHPTFREFHHRGVQQVPSVAEDRKSTRLNSSHLGISYAVFCLKKKKTKTNTPYQATTSNLSSMSAETASTPHRIARSI